jgi:DNA-binding transcriptional regulator YiaG
MALTAQTMRRVTMASDEIEVTDENFGDLLIDALTEARAIAGGDAEPARRVRRPMTARTASVQPPRAYGAEKIQEIREKMGLSQAVFARVLNASSDTVKAWEQGKRQPDGMALTLLEVAERHPGVLLERVRPNAAKHDGGTTR